MSKLSFRARALDPSKQMPIFLAEELPDLPEYSAINRAVPQMPSGMEKEEESEHHLQRAICTGLIIPTPEVYSTDSIFYDASYPANYKMPRQLIHMQPLGLEQDVPDYDMDSADEAWVNQQNRRLDLTPLKFEQMMDRLEKSSGQTVITLNEAKALLKQDDELSIAVYDYWLNKRLKMQHPLIPTVKTENRPGASSNNPYLAFRRRTEKMQTRKNRKNDETSYEKMLKLRRDLQRATTVLEMVKRREKTKREHLHLSIEIFEKRVQLRDFSGAVYSELNASLKNSRLAFAPLYTNQYSHHSSSAGSTPTGGVPGTAAGGTSGVLPPGLLTASGVNSNSALTGNNTHLYSTASQYLNSTIHGIDVINSGSGAAGIRKEKRQYKKRKHKLPRDKQQQQQHHQYLSTTGGVGAAATASSVAHHSHLHHAHHHHHHHLHRQSSSPANANESNIETEEEELGVHGNGHHANRIGSESEDETPFAFRRKQNCDYLRAAASAGNWPWESKSDREYGGFCDSKYRFTLTSIRHPRPRCIGFARRRLGRGGRVIFDRVSTNFDDFWSKLDYTILESGGASAGAAAGNPTLNSNEFDLLKKRKLLRKRMPSPPTVVDLPTSTGTTTATTTPANVLKTEIIENNPNAGIDGVNACGNSDETDFDEFSDLDLDDEAFSELQRCANYKIAQDARYTSTVSLKRRRLEHLLHKRKKRRRQLEVNGVAAEPIVSSKLNGGENATFTALPPRVLRELAATLGLRLDIATIEAATETAADDTDVDAEAVKIKQELAAIDENFSNHQIEKINANNVCNGNSSSYNNNNSSNSISLNDKFNVIKQETNSMAVSLSLTASEQQQQQPPPKQQQQQQTTDIVIKQEILDTASCSASADDSNEPLSSIQKSTATAAASIALANDIALEDEENVNLAQLSNIIKHTVKKEEPTTQSINVDETSKPRRQQTVAASVELFGYDDSNSLIETTLNQVVGDVISNSKHRPNKFIKEDCVADNDDDVYLATNGLSPSSSQRLDVCNEILSEIRRDWLHFRPKTPTDELTDDSDEERNSKLPPLFSENIDIDPLVNWSKQTPLTVEMLRLPAKDIDEPLNDLFIQNSTINNKFVSDSFKYEELDADTQLFQSLYAPSMQQRDISKSPDTNLDLNLSVDSLNDINLLEGEINDDENMLDNILQECQIDDIKTLNQATNFWNGILDGESTPVDDEVDVVDDDQVDELLGSSKKEKCEKQAKYRRIKAKQRAMGKLGSCAFSVQVPNFVRDEIFFDKQQKTIKEEPKIKQEIVEMDNASDVKTINATTTATSTAPIGKGKGTAITPTATTTVPPTMPPLVVIKKEEELPKMPIAIKSEFLPTTTTMAVPTTTTMTITQMSAVKNFKTLMPTTKMQQPQIQQQQHQQHVVHSTLLGNLAQLLQQQQQQQQTTNSNANAFSEIQTAAVGDIITMPPTTLNIAAAKSQQQQQHHILQIKQQQQTNNQSAATTQFRNITVQQLSQQQQQQQQQRQQQQQLLLHMQRDLVSNQPIITQYVTTSTANASGNQQIRQQQQQPTLTPIGATTTSSGGNHVTYIATTDDGSNSGGSVVSNASGMPQKIYIQKASIGGGVNITGTTVQQQQHQQLTNNVITLSSMKLDNESASTGQTTNVNLATMPQSSSSTTTTSTASAGTTTATRILIDNSGNNAGNLVTSPSLNIINTANGQQVAVHNISASNASAVAAGTPLIVTTQRSAHSQLTQQQLLQPTQQIVWRQISTTTGGAVLTTTTEAAAAMAAASGNKIVWTSRTAQKHQLNGPDGATDISKLPLHRKYSQRKVIAAATNAAQQQQTMQQQQQQQQQTGQQAQQQQIQIVKQQQMVQVDEDSNSAASSQSAGSSGAGSNSSAVNEITTATAVNTSTQQLQKLQMQSGKVIKMSTFPLLVSELNMQSQQQQQQKLNSAAAVAIASNHNYSLKPGTAGAGATAAIITSHAQANAIAGQAIQVGGGNKIYLTSSGAATVLPHGGLGGTTNFTIANAGDLQQQQQQQKIHYKDLQNAGTTNLKVNLVSGGGGGGVGGGNVGIGIGTTSQSGQTVVLNKSLNAVAAAAAAAAQQQQKLKRERILNMIGPTTTTTTNIDGGGGGAIVTASAAAASPEHNNKRVLYTSLLNVKKTNAGQVQMQIGPAGLQHVLRGRIGNNQTIFTNMRTLPITTMQQHQQQQQQQLQVIASSGNMPLTVTTTYAPAVTQQQLQQQLQQQQQQQVASSAASSSTSSTSSSSSLTTISNKTTTTATTAAVVVVSAASSTDNHRTSLPNNNNSNNPPTTAIATTTNAANTTLATGSENENNNNNSNANNQNSTAPTTATINR